MAAYVGTTQCLENYGAHNEDGKFASGNAYWKFKGGTDYIVTGVDRPADAMAFIMAVFSEDRMSFKEFPTDVKRFYDWELELPTDGDYRQHVLDMAVRVDVKEFFDGIADQKVYALAASAKGKKLATNNYV